MEKCPAAQRLMTHPGVDPVLIIGKAERFQCGKQIASYTAPFWGHDFPKIKTPPPSAGAKRNESFHLLPDMPPVAPSCVSIEIRKAFRSE